MEVTFNSIRLVCTAGYIIILKILVTLVIEASLQLFLVETVWCYSNETSAQ